MTEIFLLLLLFSVPMLAVLLLSLKTRKAIRTQAFDDLLLQIVELAPEERKVFAAQLTAVALKTTFTMGEAENAIRSGMMELIAPRPICLPRNQIYRGWYYRADGTRVEFEQEVKAQGNQGDKADNA